MGSATGNETLTCRTIVLAQSGEQLLAVPCPAGLVLPSIEIPRYERLAINATAALRRNWACDAICLFAPDTRFLIENSARIRYQVMEVVGNVPKSDSTKAWLSVSQLTPERFQYQEDYQVLQSTLETLSKRVPATPFAALGWFRQLKDWIDKLIVSLGLRLNGSFCQFNASPSFSLIRFETTGGGIWFKAVGDPNRQELPITIALAKLSPEYLPRILGVRKDWNGWLSAQAEGHELEESQTVQDWEWAAAAMAQMQIDSLRHGPVLLDFGIQRLTPQELLESVNPFVQSMSRLMQLQPRVPPPILSDSELLFLGEQLREALSLLSQLDIPCTLGHLDPNPGNIFVSPDRCTFLDWAEGYYGVPFFSFQYLFEHFRRTSLFTPETAQSVCFSYWQRWTALVRPAVIKRARLFNPLLAIFAHVVSNKLWTSSLAGGSDDRSCAYFRSLARLMKKQADEVMSTSAVTG